MPTGSDADKRAVLKKLEVSGWCVFLVGAAFGIIGNFFGWYREFELYDEMNHAGTSFGLALVIGVYAEASALAGARRHGLWHIALISSAVVAVGAAWEVAEWLFDRLVPGDVIHNKADTMIDLLCDAGGALLGAVLLVVLVGRRKGAPHSA